MRSFFTALQFLTIIPVNIKQKIDVKSLSVSTVYFPLIGILLGMILAGVNIVLTHIPLQQVSIRIILVVLLIILTGGLHLDGLADTCDGFLGGRNKGEILKIMRDPRIGAMGVLGIISIILLKVAILISLSPHVITISVILMCLLSRYCLTVLIYKFPYARGKGKGLVFFNGMNRRKVVISSVITLVCTLMLWKLKGLILFIAVIAFVLLAGKYIIRKLGGMTGDTLGAVNELTEVVVLMIILSLTEVFV